MKDKNYYGNLKKFAQNFTRVDPNINCIEHFLLWDNT
jgi:hypothetical protein